MTRFAIPVLALAIATFAAPAMAECSWSQPKAEKPKEKVEDKSV